MKVKALLYCTKGKLHLSKDDCGRYYTGLCNEALLLNGKIVAECEVETEKIFRNEDCVCFTKSLSGQAFCHYPCLSEEYLDEYFGFVSELTKIGYALHISNLKIFDRSMETKDYRTYNRNGKVHIADIPIYTAPKNMMYAFDYYGNLFVLISIHPEELCKILNGEKTIEVRKKVLKGMVENG